MWSTPSARNAENTIREARRSAGSSILNKREGKQVQGVEGEEDPYILTIELGALEVNDDVPKMITATKYTSPAVNFWQELSPMLKLIASDCTSTFV